MSKDPIQAIEQLTKEIHDHIERQGRNVFKRYPLTFALLATFGVSAVVSGFKGFVDEIDILRDNPLALFVLGVVILLFTGSLYKRLNK